MARRRQLSGFALYVEVVTCLTPLLARVEINRSGLSFTKGIMGSTRTDTGIPLFVRGSIAFRRSVGEGACGSSSFAVLSSSVVIVKATVQGILLNMSVSRVIILDFVIIWIRQSCCDRIKRHFRVKPASASMRGYGSELLAIDTISPFNLAASRCKLWIKSLFGLQFEKLGM